MENKNAPAFNVEPLPDLNGHVLRDDPLPGGTKYRALNLMVHHVSATNFFYAGTVMGHGALALAHACKDAGKKAHIHLCADIEHPAVQTLAGLGVQLTLKPPMPNTTLYDDMNSTADGYVFPPGFDTPAFHDAMVAVLHTFNTAPYSEIWTCAVSGTFSKAMKTAFPDKPVRVVSVAKSTHGDFLAPEKYHQAARMPPPYPSCPYTDAKIWQFATQHAQKDALIWNIAG